MIPFLAVTAVLLTSAPEGVRLNADDAARKFAQTSEAAQSPVDLSRRLVELNRLDGEPTGLGHYIAWGTVNLGQGLGLAAVGASSLVAGFAAPDGILDFRGFNRGVGAVALGLAGIRFVVAVILFVAASNSAAENQRNEAARAVERARIEEELAAYSRAPKFEMPLREE